MSLKSGIQLLQGQYHGLEPPPPSNLVDMLPRNLKHLTIRGYRKGFRPEFDEHVQQIRAEMAQKLPLLTSVEGRDEEVPTREDVEDYHSKGAPLYVAEPVEDGWLEVCGNTLL